MKDLFEKLTNAMSEAIQSGISLALHSKNQEVQALHVVWGQITNTSSLLNQALNKMNVDKSALELELKSVVERYPKSSTVTKENIKISRDLAETLQKAEGGHDRNWPDFCRQPPTPTGGHARLRQTDERA